MGKFRQRIVSGVLAFSMLLSVLPLTVFAEEKTLYGDVNRSGAVDQHDVDDLKKYLAEYDINIDTKAADINLDGSIDLRDLLLIEKYVAGMNVTLGNNVTITFDTNGGTAVDRIMLCNGAVLTDVAEEPVTYKDGYVFLGWFKEDGSPFYAEEPLTESLTLYAKFEVVDNNVEETPVSFALEDQLPDLAYEIVTADDMTAEEVLANITLLPTDGSDPVDIKAEMIGSRLFRISAVNGFEPGCSYELTLNDGLYFKDKAQSIRKSTFIIHKDEVDNLKYKDDIKYIKDTDEMFYTIEGTGEVLPVLDIALFSNSDQETVRGHFEYKDGGLAAGDTLCIYESVDPRERDYTQHDYQDDSVAFVKVIDVVDTTVFFKGLDETEAGDVLFIPDTIPFSVATLPSGDTGAVDGSAYDTDAWSFMGRVDAPRFDVGDFVVFYTGALKDLTDDSPVYYGEVIAISGTTIFYKRTTADAIKAVNDVFLSNPMSGEDLLKNIDTGLLENQIEKQAMESGFAEDAANYLVTMAAKTDNFKNMSLESVAFTDARGNKLTKAQLSAIAESKKSKPEVSVKADISRDCINFAKGVRLQLTINAEFSVDLEEGSMKFSLVAIFAEEIAVDVSVNSHAHVTWYAIVPVLDELTFSASTDVKNYSSVAVDLRIYTVENDDEEEETLWNKFKSFKEKYKDTLNKIKELERKIEEALDSPEKIRSYREQIQSLWLSMPDGSEEAYEEYCEEFNEVNMSSMLNRLLKSTSEEETEAGVQDLMERYSKLMKNETAWVTLVEKQIFEAGYSFAGGLVSVKFALDFVIRANVNISIGFSMDYLVGKRYSFWIDIFGKTSGSKVIDITDEKFAFKFYVMGYLGLKMGIEAEVSLSVLWGLASMGITGEFGPYLELWGYFIYQYTKMRPANTNKWDVDTQMAGALYLEFGIYVTISFNVNVVKKTVYNPELYDKKFPLLTAGVRNNVYAFGYAIDKDETVLIEDEDNNSNNGITMKLLDSFLLMQYMDLVEGNIEKSVYDLSNFIVTLSNSNFSLDTKTGVISVRVPEDVRYMKCNLTLTWKQGKLAFSTRDLRIVIPLVWTSLSDSELKQKFTVTVYVGNESDGYTPLWSERVMKNEYFDLPTYEEMLKLMKYSDYNYNGTNLKYKNVIGYGSQPTINLTTYTDANYYFNVALQEYALKVDNVQNSDGTTKTETFKAKFGERFNIESLKKSGTDDAASGTYTAYYGTAAKDKDGNGITSDLTRAIDISFAKELLSGTTYTATYVDNTVTVTYRFEGEVNDIPDITIKIKKGTVPPDLFTQELIARKAVVQSVTPRISNISANTTYTIVSKLKPVVLRTITYVTNGGTPIAPAQFPEESAISRPNDPVRSGYTFKGWYSDPEFKNPFVFDTMPTHDITLYAKWEGDEHTVTFDANGGTLPSGSNSKITVKNGNTFGTLPKPTFPQYKFLGWFTSRTGGTQIKAGDPILLLEDITVYARWQEKATISASDIVLNRQSTTYNTYHQAVTFSVKNGPDKNSFTVEYMRQGYDTEWVSTAVNAGTYNVRLSRAEDEDYKAFEKVYSGIYTINKARNSSSPRAGRRQYCQLKAGRPARHTTFMTTTPPAAASTCLRG